MTTTKAKTEKPYYTAKEAAAIFAVTRRTILRWINAEPSRFPGVIRPGREYLIPHEDIETELLRQEKK